MRKHTKGSIKALFRRADKGDEAIARAVHAIYKFQTTREKNSETTIENNEVGFNGAHGKKGTGMGRFYAANGYLTPKQIAWWKARTSTGKMRIDTYASQLARIANGEQ